MVVSRTQIQNTQHTGIGLRERVETLPGGAQGLNLFLLRFPVTTIFLRTIRLVSIIGYCAGRVPAHSCVLRARPAFLAKYRHCTH
jgi:hypothetical protein